MNFSLISKLFAHLIAHGFIFGLAAEDYVVAKSQSIFVPLSHDVPHDFFLLAKFMEILQRKKFQLMKNIEVMFLVLDPGLVMTNQKDLAKLYVGYIQKNIIFQLQ